MFNRRVTLNETKSYATLANLDKALVKFGFEGCRHTIAYTAEGRVTAIFPASEAMPDMMRFARHGFMTMG